MRFIDVHRYFREFPIISVSDLRKVDPGFDLRRLVEWQGKGYIKKIIKNFYIFSETEVTDQLLYIIANKIYPHSYISFEMALAYYQLIPESVYGITSATTGKTTVLKTQFGDFIYRSIRPKSFFGYLPVPYQKHSYLMAEAEKALLDYFYLNPTLESDDDFSGLRINREELFARINQEKLANYLAAFGSQTLKKRTSRFIKFTSHADI